MSEEIEDKALQKAETEKTEASTSEERVPGKSSNKVTYILLSLLLLLFSGACAYGYKRMLMLENSVNAIGSMDQRILAEVDDRIRASTSGFADIEEKLDSLQISQEMLANTINQPVEQEIHINEDYALAEVEHLLIIATYNLKLDHDVATALAAMESADARLNGLSDPAVLGVREELIAEMNELRSLNQADLSGLGLYLSDLINRVDQLTLKKNVVVEKPKELDEENVVAGESGSIKQFFVLVWEELKSLVVITRNAEVNKARLLPEEIYFVRANLKLELANARFAVFNRDTDNLKASVEHILIWLNEYSDLSDAAVKNIHDSLLRMTDLELTFPDIDISSSLESVRALIRSQDEMSGSSNTDAEIEPLQ